MITIKLKYSTDNDSLIYDHIRQYNSVYNICFNYIRKHPDISKLKLINKRSELQSKLSKMSNIELLDSYMLSCAIGEAKSTYRDGKVIFGGKKLFFERQKGKITSKDWKKLKLRPFYCVGEASKHSNRKFRINNDLNIVFSPNKHVHAILDIKLKGKYLSYVKKLFLVQNSCSSPLTYKLDFDCIYVTFDEKLVENHTSYKLKDRVFAIDMNPNYIGWSVSDWKSSLDFSVVKSGIISFKQLNDNQSNTKNESSKQKYSNLRKNNMFAVSKKLISIALYYKCGIFAIEDLHIKTKDNKIGKKFNRLVNNYWDRNAIVNNINKYCNIWGITLQKVMSQYSSMVGNILFRSLNLPDMILASIEIGRRGYEFVSQYIYKTNKKIKNIVFPLIEDFKSFYSKSLEEFGLGKKDFKSIKDLCLYIKKSKLMYRLPLDKFNLKFSMLLTPKLYLGSLII